MSTQGEIRKKLYVKQGKKCYYCQCKIIECGRSLRDDKSTLDHKLPLSRGGMKISSNEVACCLKCNREKADMTEQEFIRWRAEQKERQDG